MVTGWRRAFCTSIPKEREATPPAAVPVSTTDNKQKQQQPNCSSQSPRLSSKFGFFSNPASPRLQTQPVASPSLRCKTSSTTATSVPNSPKLQCKTTSTAANPNPKKPTNNSPRLSSLFANPSSPKSPSTFSFLRASLRLSKVRSIFCVISLQLYIASF